ncbi:DUF6355 family natural product biosynthesis protein [Streptomyces tsukubensis]|uniref:Alpha-amylase n=1 Tax=Streptomyces tsukubensis TaxID=83656 RepID=A0A1V4A0Y0_9ACTN|nr:DUF6355 family natural product biosynthesis protein [Streptomyces tsukubensis]OON72298.1 hypothetical protein B1H18_29965 [Streptomyces tsukubensis]QFR94206.1 hypothetical protein GBW32_15520 [Streptomyces tsukubensis]
MMKNLKRWGAVTILGAAAAFTGVPSAGATAAVEPCGYYSTGSYAYYNHCGRTTVQIKLDIVRGKDKTICVRPGTTGLGPKNHVRSAAYTGGAGCNPS